MVKGFRWIIVLLVVLITFINYIDRSALGYATLPITQAFHLNNAQWGVIGSSFSLGYLVVAILGGILIDRYGSGRVWTLAALAWSLVTALTSLAAGFASLFVLRVLLGSAEGPGFPAATRAVQTWLPPKEHGKALGIVVGLGVPFSLMIGGPVVTGLIGSLGWRGMFLTLGIVGVLWVVIWALLYRDHPSKSRFVTPEEAAYIGTPKGVPNPTATTGDSIWTTLRKPSLWLIFASYFTWGFMFWAFLFWIPGYLGQTYHLNLSQVGYFSVVPWAAATVGTLAGGYITDWLLRRTGSKRVARVYFMSIALLLAGLCMVPIVVAPSLGTSIAFISLGLLFGEFTAGLWWVISIDMFPTRPALAAGIADAAVGLSGLLAPSTMGFISQATGSFTGGFFLMGVLTVIGAGVLLLVRFPEERSVSAPRSAAGAM